jgi:hypothetical protein
MDKTELETLATKIRRYVAAAQTADSRVERRRAIAKAMRASCLFMTEIQAIAETEGVRALEKAGIAKPNQNISFDDYVNGLHETGLSVYRTQDVLITFLSTALPIVLGHGSSADQETTEVVNVTKLMYANFMQQKIGPETLAQQVGKLRNLFCRPPKGPGGWIQHFVPKDGGGGSGFNIALKTVEKVGKVAAVFVDLYLKLTGHNPGITALAKDEQRPMSILPYLVFSGFANQLDNEGLLPEKAFALPVEVFAGGSDD